LVIVRLNSMAALSFAANKSLQLCIVYYNLAQSSTNKTSLPLKRQGGFSTARTIQAGFISGCRNAQ
jgi:hypothetical protein